VKSQGVRAELKVLRDIYGLVNDKEEIRIWLRRTSPSSWVCMPAWFEMLKAVFISLCTIAPKLGCYKGPHKKVHKEIKNHHVVEDMLHLISCAAMHKSILLYTWLHRCFNPLPRSQSIGRDGTSVGAKNTQ
jgi:hypothetical protein